MAAVGGLSGACIRCARKLQVLRLSCSIRRHLSSYQEPVKSDSNLDSSEQGDLKLEALEDLSNERDPSAVLKALASTVQSNPMSPPADLIEDVYLFPKSERKKEECQLAKQSGVRAAEFVLQKYPKLFPLWHPQPNWPQKPRARKLKSAELEDIKIFIQDKQGVKAQQVYRKLKKEGSQIPVEIENDLLELIGFQGLGNVQSFSTQFQTFNLRQAEMDAENGSSTSASSSSESESDSDTETDPEAAEHEEEDERLGSRETSHISAWRHDNDAEKLFASMEQKNARTYDVFIQSLAKYGEHKRALIMFRNMRRQGLQANVCTYNILLGYGNAVKRTPKDIWDYVQDILSEMNMEPAVPANLDTFNQLLRLCYHLGSEGSDRALQLLRDMHAVGIEPSLASYDALLRATYYQRNPDGPNLNPDRTVLQNVVYELEQMERLPDIQDPFDVRFFNKTMGVVLVCRDAGLAKRVFALAEKNSSYLLGEKRSQFYAKYLSTLAFAENNAELVYQVYKELVPAKFLPREWVYSNLFKMAENSKQPSLVPKLYGEMKKYRVHLAPSTCKAIFSALARRTEPKHVHQYIEVMEDVLHWMRKFNIPVNQFMVGQLVRMYCVGNRLNQAWNTLAMFKEINSLPTFTAMAYLLECCKNRRNKDKAMQVFEMMASLGFHLNQKRRSDVFDHVQFSLAERQRITRLFEDITELDERRQQLRFDPEREHQSSQASSRST